MMEGLNNVLPVLLTVLLLVLLVPAVLTSAFLTRFLYRLDNSLSQDDSTRKVISELKEGIVSASRPLGEAVNRTEAEIRSAKEQLKSLVDLSRGTSTRLETLATELRLVREVLTSIQEALTTPPQTLVTTVQPAGEALAKSEQKPIDRDILDRYNQALRGTHADVDRFMKEFMAVRVETIETADLKLGSYAPNNYKPRLKQSEVGRLLVITDPRSEIRFLLPAFDSTDVVVPSIMATFDGKAADSAGVSSNRLIKLTKAATCRKISEDIWELEEKGEILT